MQVSWCSAPAMGCTGSRESGSEMPWVYADPPAGRSFSLRGDRRRLRSRVASVLSALGLGHGRYAGAYEYTALSFEEMMKSANDQAVEVVKPPVAPRTPTRTPPNEPEVINAWELMAGLEDGVAIPRAIHRCLSTDMSPHAGLVEPPPPPPWMQTEPFALIASDFDPEILSSFRKSPEEMSPAHPTILLFPEHDNPVQTERKATCDLPEVAGIVRARIDSFQEKIERRRAHLDCDAKVAHLSPPGSDGKAVVYFTSLRGVRKTFVDCCAVRSILRSYGVRVDERDVSMHAAFRAELGKLLRPGIAGAMLPCVFVDGQYLGGTEDVQVLHEAGGLARVLEGCERAPMGKLGYAESCAACGDVRFVPCETCSGSCKIFAEVRNEDVDHGHYAAAGEFRRCPECNENGLIRCPLCCC